MSLNIGYQAVDQIGREKQKTVIPHSIIYWAADPQYGADDIRRYPAQDMQHDTHVIFFGPNLSASIDDGMSVNTWIIPVSAAENIIILLLVFSIAK